MNTLIDLVCQNIVFAPRCLRSTIM